MHLTVLIFFTFNLFISIIAADVCDADVPSAESITPKNRALLVFQLPLPSDAMIQAQSALRTRNEQGVFLVNPGYINIKTELRLRSLVREGHTLICDSPNDEECKHFETVLGFYPQFTIDNLVKRNESERRASFTLAKSRMKVLVNDFAIEWLMSNSSLEKVLQIEQAMSKQQLECYYKNLECEVSIPGELRFKKCTLIRQASISVYSFELPLFFEMSGGQVSIAQDMQSNTTKTTVHGFLTHNRGRVETAYNHLKRKRLHTFVSIKRHIFIVAHVLYSPNGTRVNSISRHPRFIEMFGNFSNTRSEDTTQQSWRLNLWLSYTVSLALCLLGLTGLYPSLKNSYRIIRRRILAKIGRSISKAADFSKIV